MLFYSDAHFSCACQIYLSPLQCKKLHAYKIENNNPRFQTRQMKEQKSASDHTGLVGVRKLVPVLIPPPSFLGGMMAGALGISTLPFNNSWYCSDSVAPGTGHQRRSFLPAGEAGWLAGCCCCLLSTVVLSSITFTLYTHFQRQSWCCVNLTRVFYAYVFIKFTTFGFALSTQ